MIWYDWLFELCSCTIDCSNYAPVEGVSLSNPLQWGFIYPVPCFHGVVSFNSISKNHQKEHHPDNDFLDPDLWVDVCLLLVVSGMMVSNGKMQHGLPTSRCGAINWSWTGWVRIHWWTGLSLDGLTWFFGWFPGMIYGRWKCSCQTLKVLFLNMFCWNFDGAWPCWFYLSHFRTCICISVLSKIVVCIFSKAIKEPRITMTSLCEFVASPKSEINIGHAYPSRKLTYPTWGKGHIDFGIPWSGLMLAINSWCGICEVYSNQTFPFNPLSRWLMFSWFWEMVLGSEFDHICNLQTMAVE